MGLEEASKVYGEKVTFCYTCEKEIYKSEAKGEEYSICKSCRMKIAYNETPLPKEYRKLSDSEQEKVKEDLNKR